MENHFNCIYMYTNKVNGKRYVGQTNDFNRRHKQHISSSYNKKKKYQYNLPFHCAIRKYGIENFEIQILAEDIPTQEKMNEYEIFFIKRYNTLANDKKGYNVASGGSNGNPFAGKTEEEMEEIRRKQSELHKGEKHHMYGVHRYGKDAPNYGKHHSEEARQKMSEAKKGKYTGENHPRAKRVIQYDLNGNLIKIWDYAKKASEELGIADSSICLCCKGKYKSAGGFVWKYYKEEE